MRCLISVGFHFVPVIPCVTPQALSWNGEFPSPSVSEVLRKMGARYGLRYLTSINAYDGMIVIIVTAKFETLEARSVTAPGRCSALLVEMYHESDEWHQESI